MENTNNLSKESLVKKLERISELYLETCRAEDKVKKFTPKDNYERKTVVPPFPGEYKSEKEREIFMGQVHHENSTAVDEVEKIYRKTYTPPSPIKPLAKKFEEPQYNDLIAKKNTAKQKRGVSGIVGVASIIVASSNLDYIGLVIVSLIALAISAVVFVPSLMNIKKIDEEIATRRKDAEAKNALENDKMLEEYEQAVKKHELDLEAFDKEVANFIELYRGWREKYIEHVNEKKEIKKKLKIDRENGANKLAEEILLPAKKKLDNYNDLVTDEYLPVVDTLIELLRSGRADDLKEAINLYEDIQYREKQLELQREQERQRQYEEMQRLDAEERRYKEQEKQRRYEEKMRQEQETKMAKEKEQQEAKMAKEKEYRERDAALEAKREAERKCHWCANWRNCGMKYKPPLNCTGFRPNSTYQI